MQLAGPARGLLGRPLARVSDDPGEAVRGRDLPALPVAPGLLDLCVDEVALLAADVGGGRGDRTFRRRLLGREKLLVCGQVAAVHADLPAGQVGDLIHQPEQFAVVADDHHHPGPGRHRVVQPPARVQVQVVGRLVQQHDVRPPQEQRGQRDQDGLTAGQPFHPVIEAQMRQSQPVQPSPGALLDVPVVSDRREGILASLTRLDGVQGIPGGGDAEQVRNAAVGSERDGLRQVSHLTADPDSARARTQFPGDQPEQGRLTRAVDPDQPGTAQAQNVAFRPQSTEAPSGQLKLRSEQTIAAVIRRGSQHVGMISVTCGDTTPRGLSPRSRACQTGTSAVSLTSQPQRTSPTADSRDSLIVATPTRPANAISPWRRPGDSMIVNSFWRHLPQTVHDHEKRL